MSVTQIWVAFVTIVTKEIRRFTRIWAQTFKDLPLKPLYPLATQNIEEHWVNVHHNALSAQGCEGVEKLPFIKGKLPTQTSSCAQKGELKSWWKRVFSQ